MYPGLPGVSSHSKVCVCCTHINDIGPTLTAGAVQVNFCSTNESSFRFTTADWSEGGNKQLVKMKLREQGNWEGEGDRRKLKGMYGEQGSQRGGQQAPIVANDT